MLQEQDTRVTTVNFFWRQPDDVIAVTHGGAVATPPMPPQIQSLADPLIRKQLVLVAKVRDEQGTVVGTLSELEVFADSDAFEVYLTLVIPKRGALVSYQTKSINSVMTPISRVLASGSDWSGELAVLNTTGPLPDNRGRIIGATGEFAGLSGYHQQTFTYRRITRAEVLGTACERFVLD
jgi:hypothetical protein